MQRALADYIAQRMIRAPVGDAEVGILNGKAFGDLLRRNESTLGEVFTPQQMTSVRDLTADLQRAGTPLRTVRERRLLREAGKLSVVSQYLGHGLSGLAAICWAAYTARSRGPAPTRSARPQSMRCAAPGSSASIIC